MTSTILLSALEDLQKHFKKRTDARKGLQQHLKAAGNGLAKLYKAIPDYTALIEDAPPQYSEVQQFLAQFKEQVAEPLKTDLQQRLKHDGNLVTALRATQKTLSESPIDPVALAKALAVLRASKEVSIQTLLPQLQTVLEEAELANSERFGRTLQDALQAEGLTLAGHAPDFYIGRFGIHVDAAAKRVTLLYGKETLETKSLNVAAVIKAYKTYYKGIVERKEDGKAWIAQFHEAWKRAGKGKAVNIVEVYYHLVLERQSKAFRAEPTKKNLKEYSRATFAYDFDRFVHKERLSHEGLTVRYHTAVHAHTGKTDKSMFIVKGENPNDGTHCGLIDFVSA